MADAYNASGIWNGLYTYPYRLGEEHFTAVLFDRKGAVTGTIHETVVHFVNGPVNMNAGVTGAVDGAAVTVLKTYDGTGGWHHSVAYSGRFRDENEIDGVWRVDGISGTFLMLRAPKPPEAAEVTRAKSRVVA